MTPKPMRWTSPTEAVLFDLDGTLVYPTIDFGALNDAVQRVIAAYGASTALAGGASRPLPALEAVATASAWLTAQGLPGADALVSEGRRTILDIEREAAERARPFEGVSAMLRTLRAHGLRLAIVTRNNRAAAERILARGDLACDVLLSRDDVPRVKPDPVHLSTALALLGVAPEAALMCGDHVMDIEAGRRAGTGTVGVLSGASRRAELEAAGADVVLERITALPAVLGWEEHW